MRQASRERNKKLIANFQQLLRSGKDYSVGYMYSEAAKDCFIAPLTASNIIQDHYRQIITEEMREFVSSQNGKPHKHKMAEFSRKFSFCDRESRLIIRYINRSK